MLGGVWSGYVRLSVLAIPKMELLCFALAGQYRYQVPGDNVLKYKSKYHSAKVQVTISYIYITHAPQDFRKSTESRSASQICL